MSKSKTVHVAWVGLTTVLWATRTGFVANGSFMVRWEPSRDDASVFYRDDLGAVRRRVELGAHERLVFVPSAQRIPRIKDERGRLLFKCIIGGSPESGGEYRLWPALYAKGKCVITAPSPDSYKTRAARLADALTNGAYVGRSGGYNATPKQAERFLTLYAAGWDAGLWGDLQPPRAGEAA